MRIRPCTTRFVLATSLAVLLAVLLISSVSHSFRTVWYQNLGLYRVVTEQPSAFQIENLTDPSKASVSQSKVLIPKDISSGRLSSPTVSFVIESRDRDGKLRGGCLDYFVAKIQTERSNCSVAVECHGDGRYVFHVQLQDSSRYMVSVRLAGTVGTMKKEDVCFHELDESGYLVGPNLNSTRPVIAFLYDRDASAEHVVYSRPSCSAEDFYRGHFEELQGNVAIGGVRNISWIPHGTASLCQWPAFWDQQRVRSCTSGKWLAFIGDSTLMEIACHLAYHFYGSFNLSWVPPVERRCSKNQHSALPKCPRRWDTGSVSADLPRISFYFVGHYDSCRDCMGLSSFRHSQVMAGLMEVFGNWSVPGSVRPADLLLFNSGLHDLCGGPRRANYSSFFDMLPEALELVKPLGKTVVWKTISPKFERRTCSPNFGHFPRVPWMNERATALAKAHGFLLADQYHMNLAHSDGNDGAHCRLGIACFTFASSLLNFLCPIS